MVRRRGENSPVTSVGYSLGDRLVNRQISSAAISHVNSASNSHVNIPLNSLANSSVNSKLSGKWSRK